jgi:MFS family permease
VGVDGIAYLDMAKAYLSHDWHSAINGYWSPLYSWLLALLMGAFTAKPESELLLARALNFAIFLVALLAFGMCWNTLAERARALSSEGTSLAEAYPAGWTIFGYALFVMPAAWYVGALVPDMAVAAIVFGSIALLLRLEDAKDKSLAGYATLGALLGVGYYAKVIIFYFAVFLFFAMLVRHVRGTNFTRTAVAGAAFLIVISPFVFILSRTLGHFTIGESGRLNYAWLANIPETKNWLTDDPTAAALPFYPGPLLHDRPSVFQLPVLSGVTYAPRYDPSRYDFQNHPHFELVPQVRRIVSNSKAFNEVIRGSEEALLLALIILAMFSPREFGRRLAKDWFWILPIFAIVTMYVLVYLSWRYLLAFIPLLWGAALGAVSIPGRLRETVRPVMLAGLVVFGLQTVPGLLHYLSRKESGALQEMKMAESLSAHGIRRGDFVATIGDGKDALWAQMAGVSINAELWSADVPAFMASPSAEQHAILRSMNKAGAKVVVWRKAMTCPAPWLNLSQQAGCIFLPAGDNIRSTQANPPGANDQHNR